MVTQGATYRVFGTSMVGQCHYDIARGIQKILRDYKSLQDIIAVSGLNALSEEDKLSDARAQEAQRFLSQPFFVAEIFTGSHGSWTR